jgi:hypothetical protein
MTNTERLRAAETFFSDEHGLAGSRGRDIWKNRRFGPLTDRLFDMRLRAGKHYQALLAGAPLETPQRILVVGIDSGRRPILLKQALTALESKLHHVTMATGEICGRGRFQNINLLLAKFDLSQFDWLIMIDDDIMLPPGFTDIFIHACLLCDFQIAMPSHRFGSYSGYEVTRRGWGTIARATNYVESGPVVAFQHKTFEKILPFPELKFGWGLDIHWPLLARQEGWRQGVVDAAPMRHVSPIGGSYPRKEANAEGCGFIAQHGHLSRTDTFRNVQSFPA